MESEKCYTFLTIAILNSNLVAFCAGASTLGLGFVVVCHRHCLWHFYHNSRRAAIPEGTDFAQDADGDVIAIYKKLARRIA